MHINNYILMIHAKFYRKFVKNGLPKIVWPCIGITHRKIFLLKSIALKFIATLAHDKWTLKGAGLLLSGQPLIIHSSVSSILISRFLGLNKSLDLYNCITYIPMNFGYYRYDIRWTCTFVTYQIDIYSYMGHDSQHCIRF